MLIANLPTLLEREQVDSEAPFTGVPPPGAAAGYDGLADLASRSQRQARERTDVERLRAWVNQEAHGRTEATRRQTPQLRRLLRSWFESVAIDVEPSTVTISAKRRHALPPPTVTVSVERAASARLAPPGHRQMTGNRKWAPAEILGGVEPRNRSPPEQPDSLPTIRRMEQGTTPSRP